MSDSHVRDRLDRKHERNRQERVEGIKRWVEYIRNEPPTIWGPQQNAVVESQLTAAQSVQHSASHQQHVSDVAEEIRQVSSASDEDSN